jgi:integrase
MAYVVKGGMEESMPSKTTARTVRVQVRHSPDCKNKHRGPYWRACACPKILRVYEGGGSGANRRVATKTNNWDEAEDKATAMRDSWNPVKQELNRLKTEKEATQVSIAEAVALYCGDMVTRKCASGTVAMARSLFGHVDADSKDVLKNGHLFDWLATIPPTTRPAYIADITPAHLTAWRSSWKFGDYTATQRWGMTRSFFIFCHAHGWIKENPARNLRSLKFKKGARTAIFSDDQYDAILAAVKVDDPPNRPAATRAVWQQRLMTFLELLRWSGMAPIDAVQWRPESVDGDGVLRYRRQKTGETATVTLPDHLVILLRSVPLEKESVGADQPFRMKNFTPDSDRVTWGKRLLRLFALAEIKEVRNEVGRVRPPHVYMLRDTFAVWNLRHGVPLHTLAKMLGHSDPATTARAYLPYVKELEALTIAEGRKALAQGMPKPDKPGKVINIVNR